MPLLLQYLSNVTQKLFYSAISASLIKKTILKGVVNSRHKVENMLFTILWKTEKLKQGEDIFQLIFVS